VSVFAGVVLESARPLAQAPGRLVAGHGGCLRAPALRAAPPARLLLRGGIARKPVRATAAARVALLGAPLGSRATPRHLLRTSARRPTALLALIQACRHGLYASSYVTAIFVNTKNRKACVDCKSSVCTLFICSFTTIDATICFFSNTKADLEIKQNFICQHDENKLQASNLKLLLLK